MSDDTTALYYVWFTELEYYNVCAFKSESVELHTQHMHVEQCHFWYSTHDHPGSNKVNMMCQY